MLLSHCIGLLAALGSPGHAEDRFLLTSREAVVARPPALAAEGELVAGAWSPDGAHLLALVAQTGRPPDLTPRLALVLWSDRAGSRREVWTGPAAGSLENPAVAWLGNRQALVAASVAGEPRLLHVETAKLTVRLLQRLEPGVRLWPAPNGSGLVIARPSGDSVLVATPGPQLRLVSLPPGVRVAPGPYWSEDGRFVVGADPVDGEGRWRLLDLSTGELTTSQRQPAALGVGLRGDPVALAVPGRLVGSGGPALPVNPLWLSASNGARLLISPDTRWHALRDGGGPLAYADAGAVWVVRLTRYPRGAFVARHAARWRAEAETRARAVAWLLRMYSEDYDGALPGGESGAAALIPYAGGSSAPPGAREALRQLTYTATGGPAAPGQVVGFVATPVGRALIHGDWRVVWEPAEP
jgi:hypothetical protein